MKSKVIKRAAAALTAMVMAVSMMAVSVSAQTIIDDDNQVKLVTSMTTSEGGNFRTAKGTCTNLSSVSRLGLAHAKIFETYNSTTIIDESHKSSVIAKNGSVNSGAAEGATSVSRYAEFTAVLYNGNVVMSGEYVSVASRRLSFDDNN